MRAGVEENCFFGVRSNHCDTICVREGEVGIEEEEDARQSTRERECRVKFRPGEGVRVKN